MNFQELTGTSYSYQQVTDFHKKKARKQWIILIFMHQLILAMVNEAPKVIADPHDYDARANIMWGGMPKNFEELGASEKDIEKLAYTC